MAHVDLDKYRPYIIIGVIVLLTLLPLWYGVSFRQPTW